jgi:hypothetical protein
MSSKNKRKKRRRNKNRQSQKQHGTQELQAAQPQLPSPLPKPIEGSKEPEKRQAVADTADQHNHGREPSRPSWWSWVPSRRCLLVTELLFAGTIAAATVAQVYYGNKQWDATDKQWQVMVLQQRSWLQFEAFAKQPAPGHMMIEFDLHNTGQSPATTKQIKVGGYANYAPLDPASVYQKYKQQAAIIPYTTLAAPRDSFTIALPKPMFVDEGLIDELNTGKTIFVVFATVEYTDAGGISGETQQSWVYDPKSKDLAVYGHYNYMK